MDSEALLLLRTEESCRHIASKCLGEIEFSAALDMFDIFLKLTVIGYLRAEKAVFSRSLAITKTAVIYSYIDSC